MQLDRDLVRVLTRVNLNIRRSLDMDVRGMTPEEVQVQYLAFEGVRYLFDRLTSNARPNRDRTADGAAEDYMPAVRGFAQGLNGLAMSDDFRRVAARLVYRNLAPDRDQFSIPAGLAPLLDRSRDRPTVFDAVVTLRDFVNEIVLGMAASGGSTLSDLVPDQKIAPVMFEVVEGKLVIKDHKSETSEAGATAAELGREELVERGQEIIRQLEQSNCDRRMLNAVRDLQERLENSENAIRIGMSNIACEVMHMAFEKELPDAVSAALRVQTMGVGMYLAQFPDWIQFSTAASSAKLGTNSASAVVSALDSAIDATSSSTDLADPEVPATLKQLREIVTDPKRASKRAVFAAIRSVENLVIQAFSYGSGFLHDTITKTSNEVSTKLSKGIAVALLGLGLTVASGLLPISGNVEGLGWLREAVVVVQREISSIPK